MANKSFLSELLPHDKQKQRTEKILLKAHEKSQKIIEKSIKKANQILIQANFIHKKLKEELKLELKQAVQNSAGLYQRELESAVKNSLLDFQAIIQKEFKTYQEFLRKKTEEEWLKIAQELELYKKAKKQELEKNLALEIRRLAREVLGKSLPFEFQEKLIFEALQKAKEQGII